MNEKSEVINYFNWPSNENVLIKVFTLNIIENNNNHYVKVITEGHNDLLDDKVRKNMIDNNYKDIIRLYEKGNFLFLDEGEKSNLAKKTVNEDSMRIGSYSLWLDTYYAYSSVMNPTKNKEVQQIIDVLFNNILFTYKDFCEDVKEIDAANDYEFSFYKPKGNPPKYDLMTFLLNRAISNINGFSPRSENGNAYSHYGIIHIDAKRYESFRGKASNEWINISYIKSKMHETAHALHVLISNDGTFRNSEKNLTDI